MRPHADLHLSGLHDADDDTWLAAWEQFDENAVVGAVTECRRDFAKQGWAQYRDVHTRGAECAITWNRAAFALAGPRADCAGSVQLTDLTFLTGKGHVRPGVVATWVLLEGKGGTLLRVAAHMPSSVQRGDRFSTNLRRVRAWRSALAGMRREVRRLQAEHRPDETTVSCDWNVDLTRVAWRHLVNTALSGTGLTVKAAPEGTHHDRAIDGHASTMRRKPSGLSRVLDRVPGFDHRGVVAVLTSKEK